MSEKEILQKDHLDKVNLLLKENERLNSRLKIYQDLSEKVSLLFVKISYLDFVILFSTFQFIDQPASNETEISLKAIILDLNSEIYDLRQSLESLKNLRRINPQSDDKGVARYNT